MRRPKPRIDLRVTDTMLRKAAADRIVRDDNWEYYDELSSRVYTDHVYAAEDHGWVVLHRDGRVTLTNAGRLRAGLHRAEVKPAAKVLAFSGCAA